MNIKPITKQEKRYKLFWLGIIVLFLTGISEPVCSKEPEPEHEIIQAIQLVQKERGPFFKNAHNSPLEESDKLHFKDLHHHPIDLGYCFEGETERHVININNPKYYAICLTNKVPEKRYIQLIRFNIFAFVT